VTSSWQTGEREGWIRINAGRWLAELDPRLQTAELEVVAMRHAADISRVLLQVSVSCPPPGERFQVGMEIPFSAAGGDDRTAPRPARYFRRATAEESWRPYATSASGAGGAPLPQSSVSPRTPLSLPVPGSSLALSLAIVLILLGLYASFAPLLDIARGVRSYSWQKA